MTPSKPESGSLPRRNFLQTAAVTAGWLAAIGVPGASAATEETPAAGRGRIGKNDRILFQGDSITDAGRSRSKADMANDQAALGNGYAWLAGAGLLVGRPEDGLKVFNRGVSGNKVFQLAERWDGDCLQLKPDVLSILIGVNDIWHKLNGNYDGTVEKYEKDYRALLEQTRRELPAVRLVICEPFVLRCGAVNEKWFPGQRSWPTPGCKWRVPKSGRPKGHRDRPARLPFAEGLGPRFPGPLWDRCCWGRWGRRSGGLGSPVPRSCSNP